LAAIGIEKQPEAEQIHETQQYISEMNNLPSFERILAVGIREVQTIREEFCMGKIGRILLASALAIPLLATGCAEHRRAYAWGPGENAYYARWERETHRNHVEYQRRSGAEQRGYRNWRRHHRD
jgi:hypothetical protein